MTSQEKTLFRQMVPETRSFEYRVTPLFLDGQTFTRDSSLID
jgi:hypothetical protein